MIKDNNSIVTYEHIANISKGTTLEEQDIELLNKKLAININNK